ncbi:hypothetical protein [Spirosoma aerolatum]|uniref:hypothetical protein n=1 Tax=Spirosoma aerolatum TaxID=1211326 RepID=UPI0009AD291C|nr:hypothetical protein [Spirosoma aerolatum]
MVHFEKDKLIIELEARDEKPLSLYYRLIDSLLEVVWFALENDEDGMIRKEVGTIAYYLLNEMLMKGQPEHKRLQP